LKVIASSDVDCDAPGLAQTAAVFLREGTTAAIHATRGGEGVLVTLPESPASASSTLVRFVHLMDGAEPLDVFLADTSDWPPALGPSAVSSLEFGAIPTAGSVSIGQITAEGYLSLSVGGSEQTFGVLDPSELPTDDEAMTPWLATVRRKWAIQEAYGVYAVGRVNDPGFPPEMVDCLESEDDGIWTACRGTSAQELSVSAFHTTLSGADYPYYRVRAEQMGPVVAAADTDVMCLAFVMSDDDKRAIEEASVQAGFHVAWADMNLDTPVDDPRRFDGTIPEAPTGPPCEGEGPLQVVADVLDCLAENCTGGAGWAGGLEDVRCMAEHCLLTLLVSEPEEKRCVMCLGFTVLDGSPLDRVEQQCTTNKVAGMAFEGNSGVMLLSRLPIRDVEHRVLPSWVWRASVAKASVDLPSGQVVDVYCSQLSTSERAPTFSYLGPYGEGPLGDSLPWTNEALLQAQRLMEFVRQSSGPRPAVVAGAFESGLPCEACQPPLEAFGPEVLTDLTSSLGLGTARDYTWHCLECGDNPLRAVEGRSDVSLWTDHILLHQLAKTDVIATSRIFEAPVMTIPVDGEDVKVPPSSHYGLKSVIRLR